MQQTTIKKDIQFTGVGLHTGKNIACTLSPARENTGIVFCIHTQNGTKKITPTPSCVSATGLATTLTTDGVSVSTVEHLLAAIRAMGVDNILITVDGSEIPVLDGSADFYVSEITRVGLQRQAEPRKVLRLTGNLTVGNKTKFVRAEPCDGFVVDYTIDFPHKAIGRQRFVMTVTPEGFVKIAKARTFGFLKDVEAMREHGLALGGSLNNAIVLDDEKVLNEEGLRYADEFVRHKLLDFIGDMGVFPYQLQGKFTVYCSGHTLNNEFARRLEMSGLLKLVTESESQKQLVLSQESICYPAGRPSVLAAS